MTAIGGVVPEKGMGRKESMNLNEWISRLFVLMKDSERQGGRKGWSMRPGFDNEGRQNGTQAAAPPLLPFF